MLFVNRIWATASPFRRGSVSARYAGWRRARRPDRYLSVIGVVTGLLVLALAAMPARANNEAILSSALTAYDKAVATARENPPAAIELYRQAAAGFESLATGGVRSAALEYNLGNTYYRLGDFGKAVLHFRRAQRLDPGDTRIAANLRYARERVEPFIPASGQTQLIDRLLFWNNNISINGRFWIAVGGSIIGWAALLAWLRIRGVGFGIVAALGIALGLANSASVGVQLMDEKARPHAVVTTPHQKLRAGRGDGHEEVLKQPLGSGVELRLLDVRGDWVEVRLSDNVSGWLPLSAITRV